METLGFVLAEVEDEGNQLGQYGAEVHVWEVFAEAKEDLFDRVHADFVETVSE